MTLLAGPVVKQLKDAALAASPNEAVGVIVEDQVIILTNVSESPHNSFALDRKELIGVLPGSVDLSKVVLWHSHPSGGVGPSRADMSHKTPFNYHLVVTVSNGDIVLTWY